MGDRGRESEREADRDRGRERWRARVKVRTRARDRGELRSGHTLANSLGELRAAQHLIQR